MNYFQKKLQKYSKSRAGGLTDLKLLARLEAVADSMDDALCIDGGPPPGLKWDLETAWDDMLDALKAIHNHV